MNNQKLIIYDFPELFKVLDELKNYLNFEIISTTKEEFLNTRSMSPHHI